MAQLWCVGEVRLARDGAQDTEAEKCGHSPESTREPLSVPGQEFGLCTHLLSTYYVPGTVPHPCGGEGVSFDSLSSAKEME